MHGHAKNVKAANECDFSNMRTLLDNFFKQFPLLHAVSYNVTNRDSDLSAAQGTYVPDAMCAEGNEFCEDSEWDDDEWEDDED